jgi:hypothetical protein
MSAARRAIVALALSYAMASAPSAARADFGGISFWLPGLFGSLAAAPSQLGWALTTIYYHTSVEGGGRENFVLGGVVVAGVRARADLNLLA